MWNSTVLQGARGFIGTNDPLDPPLISDPVPASMCFISDFTSSSASLCPSVTCPKLQNDKTYRQPKLVWKLSTSRAIWRLILKSNGQRSSEWDHAANNSLTVSACRPVLLVNCCYTPLLQEKALMHASFSLLCLISSFPRLSFVPSLLCLPFSLRLSASQSARKPPLEVAPTTLATFLLPLTVNFNLRPWHSNVSFYC